MDIIEVSDDGTGVPLESRPYMATRHATSKIDTLDDIYHGTGLTMGFRGEALFAMANVSESLVVASRTDDEDMATKIVFGNDGVPIVPITRNNDSSNHEESNQQQPQHDTYLARKVGTTVAVVKPFGKLPARRSDLARRIRQERTKIFKLVESYGIFNVGICFRLMDINNNREDVALATSLASKTIRETSSTLCGPSFLRGITAFDLPLESFFNSIHQQQHLNNNARKQQQNQDQDQGVSKEGGNKYENKNNNDTEDDICYNWGIRGLISTDPSLAAAAVAQQQQQKRHQRGVGRTSSSSSTSRSTTDRVRNNVYYYSINGRIVDLPNVTALLRKLWMRFLNSDTNSNNNKHQQQKKPSAILEFTLPNNSFDINLSPDKRTVLFTNEIELLSVIEEHVTKHWSNESSSIFIDGGGNTALSQQRPLPSSAARVSIGGGSTGANTSKEEVDNEENTDQGNDQDSEDGNDSDDGIKHRRRYKRRFAFVHDFSNAKMQHDLDERKRSMEEQERNNDTVEESNNINDDNDEDDTRRRPLKQAKLCTIVLDDKKIPDTATETSETTSPLSLKNDKNNRYNTDDDVESSSLDDDRPRKKQKIALQDENQNEEEESATILEALPTDFIDIQSSTRRNDCDNNENDSKQVEKIKRNNNDPIIQADALFMNDNGKDRFSPFDKVSDLERRKWTEIQSKFNSSRHSDDDEYDYDDEKDNNDVIVGSELEQTQPIQTCMRTKQPVTPEEYKPNSIRDSNNDNKDNNDARSHQAPSSLTISSIKEKHFNINTDIDVESHTNKKANNESSLGNTSSSTTSSALSSSSPTIVRRPLLANLHQFAFQSNDDKSAAGMLVGRCKIEKNIDTNNILPPPTNEKMINSKTNRTRSSRSTTTDEEVGHNSSGIRGTNDTKLTDHTTRRSGMNVNSVQLNDTKVISSSTTIAKDDSSATTEQEKKKVVIWDSFSSTDAVCYQARLERLNMIGRKRDIDKIRRSRARKSQNDGNRINATIEDSFSSVVNEIDKEVGFDGDDNDNDNDNSTPFIRISKSTFRDGMEVIGQFNLGFILAKDARNHLWILDQHACEEKYNFEQLCKKTIIHEQPLIRPLPLELNPSEEACVMDHMDIFQANGFRFTFDADAPIRHRLSLTALPHSGAHDGRKAVQVRFFLFLK